MKSVAVVLLGTVVLFAGQPLGQHVSPPKASSVPAPSIAPAALSPTELTGIVKQYCVVCHNTQLLTGNISLEDIDVAKAPANAEKAEKMITKLRAGMMPPPGAPRPGKDTLLALV